VRRKFATHFKGYIYWQTQNHDFVSDSFLTQGIQNTTTETARTQRSACV